MNSTRKAMTPKSSDVRANGAACSRASTRRIVRSALQWSRFLALCRVSPCYTMSTASPLTISLFVRVDRSIVDRFAELEAGDWQLRPNTNAGRRFDKTQFVSCCLRLNTFRMLAHSRKSTRSREKANRRRRPQACRACAGISMLVFVAFESRFDSQTVRFFCMTRFAKNGPMLMMSMAALQGAKLRPTGENTDIRHSTYVDWETPHSNVSVRSNVVVVDRSAEQGRRQ